MNNSDLIIATFIITALYDAVLRLMSENYDSLPLWIQEYKFIKYLIPYFKKHTLLAATLIAGFVGAGAQYIILKLYPFPKNVLDIKKSLLFLLLTFVVSALYGFPMKATKLFPHLDESYYKNLGPVNGAIHDGVSGLIVQTTLLAGVYLLKKK